ncbi:MAG: FAD-dependent oxidoreductase [Rubrivivax sp.]|nr:FAD-dependent oxidoreductase [Rubrivivax sp.]
MSTLSAGHTTTPAATTLETEVLIIGGGVTGAGIMRDLALRGIHSVLIDKIDLCAGASGGNHGLLHSGARYVSTDLEAAIECRQENELLKRLAPQCIEATAGLFVAVEGDDPGFAERFPELCRRAAIPCDELTVAQARTLEPHLADKLVRAYRVPDASIDPFHLALANVDHARLACGSLYRAHTELLEFEVTEGEIRSALCRDHRTHAPLVIRARQFVNAGGAWAMDIARRAGCTDVNLHYVKGTLLVNQDRMTRHVINRLRPPGDGDILVPGGTVSLLGTTSTRVSDPDRVAPTVEEIDRNIREGSAMIPALAGARYTRAFSRVRPLLQGARDTSDRAARRGFALMDHRAQGLANFCTITGGKLTTFRLMAEKTADLVAARLGNRQACTTGAVALPLGDAGRWTEPGAAPRQWVKLNDPADMILCECEMVPQSAIDQIVAAPPGEEPQVMSLEAISLRSRVGKGPCQGSFCGIRVSSYLYDQGYYRGAAGLTGMRDFFDERFKGQRLVIWGQQAAQMELAEALHCGLLGLDALPAD